MLEQQHESSFKKNWVCVDIVMGSISSLNKTLNSLKSNPNKLNLVQQRLCYLLDQVLLFSIFIKILFFIMVWFHSYEHFNHSKEKDKRKKNIMMTHSWQVEDGGSGGGRKTNDDGGWVLFWSGRKKKKRVHTFYVFIDSLSRVFSF